MNNFWIKRYLHKQLRLLQDATCAYSMSLNDEYGLMTGRDVKTTKDQRVLRIHDSFENGAEITYTWTMADRDYVLITTYGE